ncbi:MAG TPA: hypothetical protein VFR81_10780 [Longimicrobium sp.]|nr:hypothetical protein [Longimicrobium sp.]
MREIRDAEGRTWEVVGVESMVAHMKEGRTLAFRPAGDPAAEPVLTTVQFNSAAAADFAIRTMGEKELQRRLAWAKTDAGIA